MPHQMKHKNFDKRPDPLSITKRSLNQLYKNNIILRRNPDRSDAPLRSLLSSFKHRFRRTRAPVVRVDRVPQPFASIQKTNILLSLSVKSGVGTTEENMHVLGDFGKM